MTHREQRSARQDSCPPRTGRKTRGVPHHREMVSQQKPPEAHTYAMNLCNPGHRRPPQTLYSQGLQTDAGCLEFSGWAELPLRHIRMPKGLGLLSTLALATIDPPTREARLSHMPPG